MDGYTPISTAYELADIANNTSGKYYLTNNMNMGEFGPWTPIENFSGILDVNNYSIKDLVISSGSLNKVGLFSNIEINLKH